MGEVPWWVSRVEEDSAKMSAVSSAWGKSRQMLVWGKCQSTCLTFLWSRNMLPSTWFPQRPQLSAAALILFLSFIPQILHHTLPSCQIFELQMIYYNTFVFLLLLPGLSSSLQVAMTTNWDVMLALHPHLTSCERRLRGHTKSWFHGKACQRWEVRENKWVCVCGGLTDLGLSLCRV